MSDALRVWTASDRLPTPLSSQVKTMSCVRVEDMSLTPHPYMCNYGPGEWVSRSYNFKPAVTYEAASVAFFLHTMAIAGPGTGFLDVGSNFGTYSVHIANRGHPVVLVDVNRNNLYLAHNSANWNGIKHMTFVNHAIWKDSSTPIDLNLAGYLATKTVSYKGKGEGTGEFTNVGRLSVMTQLRNKTSARGRRLWGVSPATHGKATEGVDRVPSITLTDLGQRVVNQLPVDQRFKRVVMKLDVQGAERAAFQGADDFFKEFDVLMVMTEKPHYPSVGRFLRAHGFVAYCFKSRECKIPEPLSVTRTTGHTHNRSHAHKSEYQAKLVYWTKQYTWQRSSRGRPSRSES